MWDNRSVLSEFYDWVEFTLANGQTNYDVALNQTSLFSNIKVARNIVIDTNINITARFSRVNLPSVKIDAVQSPVEFKGLISVRNIFLTNASGSDATVRIMLA